MRLKKLDGTPPVMLGGGEVFLNHVESCALEAEDASQRQRDSKVFISLQGTLDEPPRLDPFAAHSVKSGESALDIGDELAYRRPPSRAELPSGGLHRENSLTHQEAIQ